VEVKTGSDRHEPETIFGIPGSSKGPQETRSKKQGEMEVNGTSLGTFYSARAFIVL
jgi:hypothetical protein